MHYLYDLIAEGEHEQLDFKFAINDMRKIAKTLAAFANTSGGRLLVGLKDNGNIKGCRISEEKHMLEFAADEYCNPPVEITFEEWNVEGKYILEAIVSESPNKPVYALDKDGSKTAYVRVLDEVTPMHPVLFIAMKSKEKQREIKIEYSDNEKNILSFIHQKSGTEFYEIQKISNVSRSKTQQILANFLNFDVLEILYENNKWKFYTKDGGNN